MFGLSLTKILFTVVVVAAIWYGFKFMQRMQDSDAVGRAGKRPGVGRGAGKGRTGTSGDGAAPADDTIETMVECDTCGSFVAASGARSCGREDCPYPG